MSRKARDGRWNSKFALFVQEIGVKELATQLDMTPGAVYQWVRGKTSPHHKKAIAIQKIAGQGKLSIEEIYR